MKNPYLKNLSKIDFVVAYACVGICKHCTVGNHSLYGDRIEPKIAHLMRCGD